MAWRRQSSEQSPMLLCGGGRGLSVVVFSLAGLGGSGRGFA
ncbi:hypothetical protein SAMN02745121_00989 [Nannocystis exedens]|uniref:Uncharacterized protein n=1 Tax=Nannocystis exedens TaxID=54 RepID=A0A1I1U5A9_9BACT|nr:hypothetical protein NAEX_04525 [Nannocystis exedens]SFD66016.1 hypothetical protein SAMN02745121_00989 [Nannocystis exedens]